MAITRTEVELVAPELAGESDARMTFYINCAVSRISGTKWGDCITQAQALLVAHMLTLSNAAKGGGSGAVSGKTVGSVSVSFAIPQAAANMSTWAMTGYGAQLLELMRANANFNLPFTTGRYG